MESSTLYNSSSSSAPKMERKYIEKNRRCQMKTLYFKLSSLLPHQHSKDGLALPDKIDEAVKYIQSLQVEIEKYKQKKEKLMSRKREHSFITKDTVSTPKKAPHFEIHKMGPELDMVIVNGLDNSFISFSEIMHVLHQQGAEVVQTSFSANTGNSVFHILHPKFAGPTLRYQATANISTRLNELIYGTAPSCLESESKLDIWDFEIIDFN